ncbi:uncharacterized protein LOC117646577 [Thrips palmi]|uniref:Regulatory protein zeste n=1 Tax=Thrips palmi TaxID=161013 RepID=A0A6P8Z1L0_THRPL|nr:uncharacterized protein LOC117646577 [Thrips palmi]
MCEHPKFARGAQMGYDGTRTREEMWEELAEILNKLGGRKEVEQWQVSWRDIKSKATAKAAGNRKDRAATGNKEITTIPLTELEQKVPYECERDKATIVAVGHGGGRRGSAELGRSDVSPPRQKIRKGPEGFCSPPPSRPLLTSSPPAPTGLTPLKMNM